MKMTGAQAIIRALELESTEVIFGYPGAAICPFYDALYDSRIRHVLTRNEQAAVHAANGYARVTGKTGVCVATSGPGATNLITGIATAYMDSIPVVAITGQVSSELIGRDVFQEADITGATAPFCKHNYLVKETDRLPDVVKEAFHIASTGRPGPVLIDIPIDIQLKTLEFRYPDSVGIKGYKPTYRGHQLQIKKIAEAIAGSRAPLICAGGGIMHSGSSLRLQQLMEKCGIPLTTTLMGIGAVPSAHELNLGMLGSHGNHAANYAVHNTDLLIIIGARAGDRAMGSADRIAEKARIVHIDIDPAEIGKNIDVDIPIVGDAGFILGELLNIAEKGDVSAWNEKIRALKNERRAEAQAAPDMADAVKPAYLLGLLSELAGDSAVYATEVGQNQIWAAKHLKMRKPRTFITSGGMGTMGFGLPAAVGAKVGGPDSEVINISGDGSFQMSMGELGTIKQNGLSIKIVLFNNSRLGMVRELQKQKYCCRYKEVSLEGSPDFVKLFEAYGFQGEKVSRNSEAEGALKRMLASRETYLLECVIDPEEPTL